MWQNLCLRIRSLEPHLQICHENDLLPECTNKANQIVQTEMLLNTTCKRSSAYVCNITFSVCAKFIANRPNNVASLNHVSALFASN